MSCPLTVLLMIIFLDICLLLYNYAILFSQFLYRLSSKSALHILLTWLLIGKGQKYFHYMYLIYRGVKNMSFLYEFSYPNLFLQFCIHDGKNLNFFWVCWCLGKFFCNLKLSLLIFHGNSWLSCSGLCNTDNHCLQLYASVV